MKGPTTTTTAACSCSMIGWFLLPTPAWSHFFGSHSLQFFHTGISIQTRRKKMEIWYDLWRNFDINSYECMWKVHTGFLHPTLPIQKFEWAPPSISLMEEFVSKQEGWRWKFWYDLWETSKWIPMNVCGRYIPVSLFLMPILRLESAKTQNFQSKLLEEVERYIAMAWHGSINRGGVCIYSS